LCDGACEVEECEEVMVTGDTFSGEVVTGVTGEVETGTGETGVESETGVVLSGEISVDTGEDFSGENNNFSGTDFDSGSVLSGVVETGSLTSGENEGNVEEICVTETNQVCMDICIEYGGNPSTCKKSCSVEVCQEIDPETALGEAGEVTADENISSVVEAIQEKDKIKNNKLCQYDEIDACLVACQVGQLSENCYGDCSVCADEILIWNTPADTLNDKDNLQTNRVIQPNGDKVGVKFNKTTLFKSSKNLGEVKINERTEIISQNNIDFDPYYLQVNTLEK